jgi:hypothetical protein
MYRALHLLPLLVLAATPAAAQNTILPGQSVSGELTAADPTLDDGSHYDVWRFAAVAHHRYRVTLHSDDFDAYLSVGTNTTDGCHECQSDDDGGGGTNARVDFTRHEDGTYEIRANSYDAEQLGRYTLALEDEGVVHGGGDDGAAPAGTPIALGQAVTGELARGDRKVGISYQDTWTYQGRAGEILVVTLRSEDFDAYLQAGHYEAGECEELAHNNNGGGGRDARLTVTLVEDGAYHLHVSSADQGGTGAYTLLVESVDSPQGAGLPMPIAPGETLAGQLTDADPRADDGRAYDTWSFRGQAGEAYTITLRPQNFDGFLELGHTSHDGWRPITGGNERGERLDAQLTVTLSATGEFGVRAGASDPGATGRYTLTPQRR